MRSARRSPATQPSVGAASATGWRAADYCSSSTILSRSRALPGRSTGCSKAPPELTILATSRAPLGVTGEQEFLVLPLGVPPANVPADPETIGAYDAVALLVARARAADPRFDITPENAAAIVGITRRLDGLPLAIELGAGRLRAFSPQGLLDRLERRLPLLTSGTSETISRHRTLRGAIAWSYELLTADEQRFFRRLAPFVTSFTADAAAEVADLRLEETWANIESLIAQSLLYRHVDVGDARFAMLHTLREYAAEQLEQNGELETTFARHAGYYLSLAERCKEGPSGDRANEAIATIAAELDEVGAALRRCAGGGDRELGLRLAANTWRAWQAAGRITEGREWLTRLLDPPGPDASVRADGLVALAGLDYWQADFPAAMEAYEEALELYRTAGNRSGEAEVLSGMAMTATWNGDPSEGARLAAQARALFESLGDRALVGETFMAEGFALFQDREYVAARPLWEAALAISRELGADAAAVTQLAAVACIEYQAGAQEEASRIGPRLPRTGVRPGQCRTLRVDARLRRCLRGRGPTGACCACGECCGRLADGIRRRHAGRGPASRAGARRRRASPRRGRTRTSLGRGSHAKPPGGDRRCALAAA